MTNNHYYIKSIKNFKLTAICLLLSLLAFADTGKLYTSDKMTSSMIDCIVQDSYGYIWAGTEYGLNRYDGYKFTTYYSDATDTTTIVNNEITCFLVDNAKRLWIGCSKGIMRYEYSSDSFHRYSFPSGRQPRVESIIQDSEGNIVIGTAGYGLYSIRNGKDQLAHEDDFRKNNTDDYFSRIFEDEQHNLWRGSHLSKVTRIKTANLKPTSIKNFDSPCGPAIKFLCADHNGIYIVCMYGILRYDYRSGAMSDAGFDLSSLDAKVSIRNAIIDHHGNLYIGTSGKGLMMIPRGSKTLVPVNKSSVDFDLSTSNINDIYEDKDHNLWISCYKKGLFQLNQGTESFSSWMFLNQNYKLGSSVSSIADGGNGDILCTVQKTGVYRFDHTGKIIAHPSSPDGASTIYRDRKGNYWLGTEKKLYLYNPVSGASIPKLSVDGWDINGMVDNGEGKLYISNYGKGLVIYDNNTNASRNISMNDANKGKGVLCNDWVKALFMDSHGLLWIGTADGLSCMNPEGDDFLVFGKSNMLPGLQCKAICETAEGNMLLGTSAGLYIFNRKQKTINQFPNNDQLRNITIDAIIIDNSGDYWASTANGIWQYEHKSKNFIAHINGNGLATKEYISNAMLHNADDRIAFGIDDGITVFYPSKVRNSRLPMGDVHLTGFIVNGRSMDCTQNEFNIPYNDNSFSMDFSLLTFQNTRNITFEYRINGNSDWVALSEGSNTISFTKLNPGKYVIDVRAANNGIYSTGTKTITVVVCDPWYASTWAYIIYALLIIGGVFSGMVLYERRRKEEMEEAKMKFLINATHDIRSPLTLIMGPLNKLKKRLQDSESQADIDTIDRNAQRLLLLVNQILDERKIDKNQMKLHCRQTDMVKFVSGICTLYQYNARQRGITFKFTHTDDSLMAWIDRINFEKVITNLLSNAFKYTFDNGEIEVRLSHDAQNVVLQVIDNGIGLKEDKTEKLFERFYQGRNADGFHIEGTGIGLNLCRAIVNMHGGKISAENRADGVKGAILNVNIPLGNAHLKPEEIEQDDKDTAIEETKTRKQASKNFKILIADDDFELAQYVKNELGNWYRFDIVGNGKEALEALLSGSYDLLISDVMMPEMDGITLLKKVKTNTIISDIPVILLTSKADVGDRLDGFKKGANGFIAKPFNMDELHVLIDNLIDNVRRLKGKFSGAQEQVDKRENVEVKGNNDVLMDRIMKSINENIADSDFNVEKLTEEVGISRAQLHRKMKEITGISTGEFIRNLRLEEAARLIKENKINVTQVAYTVGFNNQTHFSTVFKKHFGMSPTEYAIQNQEVKQ